MSSNLLADVNIPAGTLGGALQAIEVYQEKTQCCLFRIGSLPAHANGGSCGPETYWNKRKRLKHDERKDDSKDKV